MTQAQANDYLPGHWLAAKASLELLLIFVLISLDLKTKEKALAEANTFSWLGVSPTDGTLGR